MQVRVLTIQLLLFSISINLDGKGSKILLVLLAITLVDILRNRCCHLRGKTIVLLLGLVSYTMIAMMNGFASISFISTHIVSPFLLSYWGRELLINRKNSEQNLRRNILLVFGGFVVMGIYSLLYGRSQRRGQDFRCLHPF